MQQKREPSCISGGEERVSKYKLDKDQVDAAAAASDAAARTSRPQVFSNISQARSVHYANYTPCKTMARHTKGSGWAGGRLESGGCLHENQLDDFNVDYAPLQYLASRK